MKDYQRLEVQFENQEALDHKRKQKVQNLTCPLHGAQNLVGFQGDCLKIQRFCGSSISMIARNPSHRGQNMDKYDTCMLVFIAPLDGVPRASELAVI